MSLSTRRATPGRCSRRHSGRRPARAGHRASPRSTRPARSVRNQTATCSHADSTLSNSSGPKTSPLPRADAAGGHWTPAGCRHNRRRSHHPRPRRLNPYRARAVSLVTARSSHQAECVAQAGFSQAGLQRELRQPQPQSRRPAWPTRIRTVLVGSLDSGAETVADKRKRQRKRCDCPPNTSAMTRP